MASLNTQQLFYLCWTEESSTVFDVSFDENLWSLLMSEARSLYVESSKRPTKTSPMSKEIRENMLSYRNENTKFICEVPSIKASCCSLSQSYVSSPFIFPVVTSYMHNTDNDVSVILSEAKAALNETFELCRRKATEVLVWLLSDSDRNYNPEIPHSIPVAYAMKGYSLSTPIMRSIHDSILNACDERNVDVLCSCFDGQWIKLATRDAQGNPLTLLQLQRDVWDQARKETRDSIISRLASSSMIKHMDKDLTIMKSLTGPYSVTCAVYKRVMTAIRKNFSKSNELETTNGNAQTGDVLSCLPNDALDVLIDTEDIVVENMNHIEDVQKSSVVEATVNEMTEENEEEANEERQHFQSRRHASTDVLLMANEMLQQILVSLQNHIKPSVATRWKTRSSTELRNIIQDSALLKDLKHDEVNVVIEHTIDIQKATGIGIKKSWRLQEKCNAISKLLGDGIQIEKERFVKKVTTLRECAARTLRTSNKCNSSSIPKMLLNVIYASVLFPESQKEWIQKSQFSRINQLQDIGNVEWFSYPEFSLERQRLEPKCVDAHHLLVNLRVKVCKDGLRGVRKQAWHDVAHNYTDVISKSIVEDLIDKQNNAYALKTFSREVAEAMRKLDYNTEADFCDLIRDWYEAEDCPGLSAIQRTVRRLGVKSFLLRDVDFGSFPIYGMYINGFTRASFEGFLQKIDTNIQLYAIAKNGTYNQRAISSLANETFFGELSAMDVTRLGCPKAINIPRLMSNVTEINHYRCDPSDRMFCMKTTKKSVYPEQSLLDESLEVIGNLSEDNQPVDRNTIILRDHFFDTSMRRRTKQRRSKRTDVSKPNEVARGCQPVRQHHKCDESKILATRRLGIELKDL